MNDHLKPIFEVAIPKIHEADIKHWFYGGLGYASIVGRFYRYNQDADFFVLEEDFGNIEAIWGDLCEENGWETRKTFIRSGRPKIELLIKGKERCSVIPVYKTDSHVSFKFTRGSKDYPLLDVLPQVSRELESFQFFTPQDNFLKRLLLDYLGCKRKHPKRIEDARHILSKKEFEQSLPNERYSPNGGELRNYESQMLGGDVL
jgi:hypothetical protein